MPDAVKKGDYYKLVGSYEGVLWNGRHWQRFDCQGCVLQLGHAKRMIQGRAITKAAEAALCGVVAFRHDIETHKKYLACCRAKNALNVLGAQ